ncbi:unnamed protein product [Polarella glacialis]|uniref:Uncharacterized protein n=1 Tax=Polarella glacialis TaxID=89957 RepID=A0A813LYT3_POLGL|nr:unnamed protein product [Polarella glacialis]|mmetsp:Transcript_100037/g.180472  ORF Transcript_100037/g.180472 Transcript_100037/m.180472 type:complete len:230 (-) Transcript_100037:245-934(-)
MGSIARLMQHLLRLPGDDPQLVRLAAAAVLLAREGRGPLQPSGWSTEEMDVQRAEVHRLELAWRTFLGAPGPLVADRSAGGAALHLAFREMEAAVKDGKPIPERDELLVRVARALLGGSYTTAYEVEATVRSMLSGGGIGGLTAMAEDALATCLVSKQRGLDLAGAGCASRVACLVGSMLALHPGQLELAKPKPAAMAAAIAATPQRLGGGRRDRAASTSPAGSAAVVF